MTTYVDNMRAPFGRLIMCHVNYRRIHATT